MAVDRREKKKRKKRQKRLKTRRRDEERALRRDKACEMAREAEEAYRLGDYRLALNKCLRAIEEIPKDDFLMGMAIQSAKICDERATLYSLYQRCWDEGRPFRHVNDFLNLGKMAFIRKDYGLSKEALSVFLFHVSRAKKRPPKAVLDEVSRMLSWCSSFEETSGHHEKSGVSSPPPLSKTVPLGGTPPVTDSAVSPGVEALDEEGRVQAPDEEVLEAAVTFATDSEAVLAAISDGRCSDLKAFELALRAYSLSFRTSYDQLLCLSSLRDVQSLWYQEETARKVMKAFRGRAISADEVGLGKTIEAGLILKEYLLRGLVRSALILAPSSLVRQWEEEIREKFGLSFITTHDPLAREDPGRFWREPFIIASLQTARRKRHMEAVISRSYDIVIVNEAHHLKNRATANWSL